MLVGVGGSLNGWVIVGNPIKMDELYRVTPISSYFRKPPCVYHVNINGTLDKF